MFSFTPWALMTGIRQNPQLKHGREYTRLTHTPEQKSEDKPQVPNLLPVSISGDRDPPRPGFKPQHLRPTGPCAALYTLHACQLHGGGKGRHYYFLPCRRVT